MWGLILEELIRQYLDGETGAQRAQVSHPRPHCELRVNLGLEHRLSGTPARLVSCLVTDFRRATGTRQKLET